MVKKWQATGIDTVTFVDMIKTSVARVSGMYTVTIGVIDAPKAFGRRPNGL